MAFFLVIVYLSEESKMTRQYKKIKHKISKTVSKMKTWNIMINRQTNLKAA